MKKIGILAWLLVLAFDLVLLASPKVQVDNATCDFGELREGDIVTHMFLLSSTGDAPLVIEKVWASCGCTTTALPKTTLAPGESVELEVVLNTVGMQGPIGKSVYVESNDPDSPRLTLHLAGSVQAGIELQAYHIPSEDLRYWFYVLIDLRNPEAYSEQHIIGAINLSPETLNDWVSQLPKDTLMILYDQDGTLSDAAAQELNAAGFPNAKSLFGGLNEWVRQFRGSYLITADVPEDEQS
jgi:rhodanese-related sulfurtransferase